MKTSLMTMTAAVMLAASGQTYAGVQTDKPFIGKQEITIKDGRLTPEALWAMGRIGSTNVSPDGKRIVYTVSYYSVKENASHTVIYVMNADGTGNTMLTTSATSENSPTWIKNGTKIAFLTSESGSSQLWEMNPDGSGRKQLSAHPSDIEGFQFSPDENKILFIAQVKYGERTSDLYPDLDKASGRVIDDLMYKHWDEWVETIPHPFIASFDGNQVGDATDILAGEPYESPMKPFGGIEQLAWSNDGKQIAYTCRKKTVKSMPYRPTRTSTFTTLIPNRLATSAKKMPSIRTWAMIPTHNFRQTVSTLPGKVWNEMATKAIVTACA